MAVRNGANIADATSAYYEGDGHLSRMSHYYDGRFGNGGDAAAIAKDMLLPGDNETVNAGPLYLIQSTGGFRH